MHSKEGEISWGLRPALPRTFLPCTFRRLLISRWSCRFSLRVHCICIHSLSSSEVFYPYQLFSEYHLHTSVIAKLLWPGKSWCFVIILCITFRNKMYIVVRARTRPAWVQLIFCSGAFLPALVLSPLISSPSIIFFRTQVRSLPCLVTPLVLLLNFA